MGNSGLARFTSTSKQLDGESSLTEKNSTVRSFLVASIYLKKPRRLFSRTRGKGSVTTARAHHIHILCVTAIERAGTLSSSSVISKATGLARRVTPFAFIYLSRVFLNRGAWFARQTPRTIR